MSAVITLDRSFTQEGGLFVSGAAGALRTTKIQSHAGYQPAGVELKEPASRFDSASPLLTKYFSFHALPVVRDEIILARRPHLRFFKIIEKSDRS